MNLETKFNIDDEVYVLHNNKVTKQKILEIKIVINPKYINKYYIFKDIPDKLEQDVFSSTKALAFSIVDYEDLD